MEGERTESRQSKAVREGSFFTGRVLERPARESDWSGRGIIEFDVFTECFVAERIGEKLAQYDISCDWSFFGNLFFIKEVGDIRREERGKTPLVVLGVKTVGEPFDGVVIKDAVNFFVISAEEMECFVGGVIEIEVACLGMENARREKSATRKKIAVVTRVF
jgi:hypothetical protein